MKLLEGHTTVDIYKEDLALIRYWFCSDSEKTDYEKIHQLVEFCIPQEVKNKARRLFGRGIIS